jgi:Transcriptional repressor TCF25
VYADPDLVPSVVVGLYGKMDVNEPLLKSRYFIQSYGSSYNSLATLSILQDLYVDTMHTLWKVPPILAWLKKVSQSVLDLVENDPKDPLVASLSASRASKYGNFGEIPLNLQRMIFVADIQTFMPRIPPVTGSIMSYDPFPPTDAVPSYYDAARHTRLHPPGSTVPNDASAIGAFLQSLLPWLHVADLPPVDGQQRGDGQERVQNDVGIARHLLDQIENGPVPETIRIALRQLIAPLLGEDASDGDLDADDGDDNDSQGSADLDA